VLVDATGNDKTLFHRSSEFSSVKFPNGNLGRTSAERRHLESIERDVRPNSLFLSAAAQKAHPLLSSIYAHLSESFKAMHWKNMQGRQRFTAEMCSDKSFRDRVQALIEFADTGISGLEISRRDLPEDERKTINAVMAALKESDPEKYSSISLDPPEFPAIQEVRMVHTGIGGRRYPMDESKESDGTQAYFSAIGPVLRALSNSTVLIIDELESSLHPLLARELVRIFNSPDLNPKGAQFIFTTHNSNLLDLDLLRRDQIWFTEKTTDGATNLYPLSDYQPRTNQNIEAGYLGGRFGAIPFLDDHLLRETLIPKEPAQTSLQFSGEE
jgi:hypothetical protein